MTKEKTLFDLLPHDDGMRHYLEKEKSSDWKWTMATDYPQKNGLKVFSCFACGGGQYNGI